MKCTKPIDLGSSVVPCNQCMACRVNKQRIWAARILMESMYYEDSSFVTLTYQDDKLPWGEEYPTLVPEHLTKFIQDFRNKTRQVMPLRYFAVGEYGTDTKRPHFHIVMFGFGIEYEDLIEEIWGQGFISISELTTTRAAYIAQYCLKKMTRPGAYGLGNRYPEFTRMSRGRKAIGGIGSPMVPWLAETIAPRGDFGPALKLTGDVWNSIRIEGKIWPLGRYIRKKIRQHIGLSEDARERAIQLGRYDPHTGEVFEPITLPEDYCPESDVLSESLPWRKSIEKKISSAELPEAKRQEEKFARRKRKAAHRTATI